MSVIDEIAAERRRQFAGWRPIETAATAIRRATYNAHGLALAGTWQRAREILAYMQDLQPGKLVVETTTVWGMREGMTDLDGVGTLLREVVEPMPVKGWNVAEDTPLPEERVYYIRTLDGREFRWTNASFVAVPVELR